MTSFDEKALSSIWEKKNHGGNPTANDDLKYAVFIGRWQPYHYGHIKMIERKIMQGIPVIIFIRDIKPDANNPLTSEQTKQLIEKYHTYKGHKVLVKIIEDIESVNYGRGVGYEVNEWVPTEEIANISATAIRSSIYEGTHEWKSYMPQILHSDIQQMLTYSDSNNE
jgi:nicotinic acid mononucleotide adenylyltransferase